MPALPPDAIAGLFGKLPARGDFVRENLPRDFTDGWDGWWQRGLGEVRSLFSDPFQRHSYGCIRIYN
jgi:type VI secretion system protein ImpM